MLVWTGWLFIVNRQKKLLSSLHNLLPTDILVVDERDSDDPNLKIIASYKIDDKDIRDEKTMLSVTGEKRAEILCSKEEFNNIDVVFASNMVRSMQTAKYLCYNQNLYYL